MPAAMQAKLLRAIETRAFARVGGNHTVSVDLRLVAATHRDLRKRVEAGEFREDLYYRLNVIALALPTLRERRADLPLLCEHFLALLAADVGRRAPRLSAEALAALEAHAWPGNARELRNALERALVLCEGDEIALEDLPAEIREGRGGAPESFHGRVDAYRRQLLVEALARAGGNQTRAAKELGLQRTYLARLIRQYGI
jgi:DNA-binding NtrC family response regulator